MKYTHDTIIFKDIKICQPSGFGFRFGCDSAVLAWFSRMKEKWLVADVGSGSGVIAILIARAYKSSVHAIELQKEMVECLEKSIELSNMTDIIEIIHNDIKKIKREKIYDAIICNPPYREIGTGKQALDEVANKARFNITMNLEDVVKFAKGSLKDKGRLFFSYDADMLIDGLHICKNNNLEPKRILFLHKDINSKAKLVFVECMLNGGKELLIEPPLFQQGKIEERKRYDDIFKGDW